MKRCVSSAYMVADIDGCCSGLGRFYHSLFAGNGWGWCWKRQDSYSPYILIQSMCCQTQRILSGFGNYHLWHYTYINVSVKKRLPPELHFEAMQNYPLYALQYILYIQMMKVLSYPRIVLSCWHLTVSGKSCSGSVSVVSCQGSLAAHKGNSVLCNGRVTRMSISHHRKFTLC